MKNIIVSFLVVCMLIGSSFGCNTTRRVSPTGEETTQTTIDLNATIVIAQQSVLIAQVFFDMWLAAERQNATLDAAALAVEMEIRQAVIDRLEGVVRDLFELKAKEDAK